MKKSFFTIVWILFSFLLKGQEVVTPDIKVKKTEIDLVYGHYLQDGDHSAVTGGTGTEELTVYAPSLQVKRTWGKNSLDMKYGIDVITSASTDNINTIVSSASVRDTRNHIDMVYARDIPEKRILVNGGAGFSIESDYTSWAYYLGMSYASKDEMKTLSAQVRIFNDDLRWGTLHPVHKKPIKLIYPSELRYQEWSDVYHRNTFNLDLEYVQILDKRNILGLFGTLSVQEGLLATPFHRVYFTDESRAVENLPNLRYKSALAVKWNRFVGKKWVLKNTTGTYIDNFGIVSASLENETAYILDYKWTILGSARFYTQKGSPYFQAYKSHLTTSDFFTSDYDLSSFQMYRIGAGVKMKPYLALIKALKLEEMTMKYDIFIRSDGLVGHVVTISFSLKNGNG